MKRKKPAETPEEIKKIDPLHESLRCKLTEIINRRPMTAVGLLELEQTARLARELLAVGKDPQSQPRKKSSAFMSTVQNPDDDALGSFVGSPPIETFGANAIREIVAALPALMPKAHVPEPPSPVLQVMAIAHARDKGLHDLADQLEVKMLGIVAKKPTLTVIPPKQLNGKGKAKVSS